MLHGDVEQRVTDAGFDSGTENLFNASWPAVEDSAVSSWMASKAGHRENMLDAEWTHAGFGVADDRRGYRIVVGMYASGQRRGYQPDAGFMDIHSTGG